MHKVKLRISEVQKERLQKAFEWKSESAAICLNIVDLDGEDVIAVTKSQCTKMVKAFEGNKGLTIKVTKRN